MKKQDITRRKKRIMSGVRLSKTILKQHGRQRNKINNVDAIT